MRTEKQKLANWTELVHPGENVEIDKGVISASGSGGGGLAWLTLNEEESGVTESLNDVLNYVGNGQLPVLLSRPPEANSGLIMIVSEISDATAEYLYVRLYYVTSDGGVFTVILTAEDADSPLYFSE